MSEYPAAEGYLQAGDEAGARECVPRCNWDDIPKPTEADSFVLGLWDELLSPLFAGERVAVLRMKCEAAGLDGQETAEVWQRVMDADRIWRGYWAERNRLEATNG